MKRILHICAGWERTNGAANIARLIAGEQAAHGDETSFRTWASVRELRQADEVWIHCGWLPCLWWAALWARCAIWVPEASYDPVRLAYHGWKKRLAGPIERWALRRCQRIVATCSAEKRWIERYLGETCPLVEVMDIKRFFGRSDVTKEFSASDSGVLHVLYLGRRHPLKGVRYLEQALGELASNALKSEAAQFELRLVSNAHGEELESVWGWCDVLCLPTLSDNLGLVVAEALERGKRVITTDGAPAWEPEDPQDVPGEPGLVTGCGGRLLFLRGYRDGDDETRVRLLRRALARFAAPSTC